MKNRYLFLSIITGIILLIGLSLAQPFTISKAVARGHGGRAIHYRPSEPSEDWWYDEDVNCISEIGCVDIVFCVDTSGSMAGAINSLQDDIDRFAYDIASVGFDYAFGLVTYSEWVNFPHGTNLVEDLGDFSDILDEARDGDGGAEDHGQAIYDAITNFDWRPTCEPIVVLITDECDDASSVSPSSIISQIVAWGGRVYMLTADCGDVDDFRTYCDTSYGMWFDYGASSLSDVFDQIVDDIAEIIEIDVTITNTSGAPLSDVVATLIPDFCITVAGSSANPDTFSGPLSDGSSHTFAWGINEIPGCTGWGDCFIIQVESGSYVDSIIGCLWVEDCGCPGPQAEFLCPEYSGRWSACEDQQIEVQYTGYIGVDPNTLCLTVEGTEYCYPHPNLTWTPSGTRGGVLTYRPPMPPGWTHLDEINVVASDGTDATGCPMTFFPESDFKVDLQPPHPVWWEHHDGSLWPPTPAWREPHDDAVSWEPACGTTVDDTTHIIISALLYDDGVGMTPLDRILSDLDFSELASLDFIGIWSSLTSIRVTVNDIPFIAGAPPGHFSRNVDLAASEYLLDPDSWFGGWAVACTIRADSAAILGLAFLTGEIEVCLEAHDLVDGEGCMPCENDTEWCCTYYIAGEIPLIADAGPDQYICLDDPGVTIGGSPTAGGGTSPYSYSWVPAAGLSSTTVANPVASPTATTTYVVTVTDDDMNTASDTMTVYVSNPVADAGRDTLLCPGMGIQLGGSPTGSGGFGPLTYSWTPASLVSSSTTPNPWFYSMPGDTDATIEFIVTITDTLGCEDVDTVVVTLDQIETDAGSDFYICVGESVMLGGTPSATGGIGPYSYNWYEYPGGTMFSSDPNPIVYPADTTMYILNVSGINPYCADEDTCWVYPTVPIADAGPDTSICLGSSVTVGGTPTASGSVPPYIYSWESIPPGFGSIIANTVVTPANNTTYIVTVTDSSGCVDIDTVLVEVYPSPYAWVEMPFPCGGITSCEFQMISWLAIDTVGDIDETSASADIEGISYDYFSSEISISHLLPDTVRVEFMPSSGWTHGDTIDFELTNIANYIGCNASVPPCSFIVDIEPPLPNPLYPADSSVLYSPPDSIGVFISDAPAGVNPASFDHIEITIDGITVSGWTYAWDGSYLDIQGLTLDGGDTVEICLDSLYDAPTYDYCLPNDTSFCWTFIILPCDLEIVAHPDTAICHSGIIDLSVDLDGGSGFYTYDWRPSDGLDDSTLANPTATVDSSINYIVTVYDESLACAKSDTATIIVSNPVANAGPDGVICPFSEVPLGCLPAATGGFAPYTYEWLNMSDSLLYTDEHPIHSFGDIDESFVLHVIDSLGCEAWDTVEFTMDYISPDSIHLMTPAMHETVTVGDVYFSWEPYPTSLAMLYDVDIDGTLFFGLDSTHVSVPFVCGNEMLNWRVTGYNECLETYVSCGETTVTTYVETVFSIYDTFWTPECTEPYAVEVHVPNMDWTACDPDSIVAFIIDSVGIVESSIHITVNGIGYRVSDPELDWDGDSILVFRPSTMWADGETVEVCVDSAENIDSSPLVTSECWEFYIDRSPPGVVSTTPGAGSTISPTTSEITFCVRDDLSGLDSVYADLDGVDYRFGPFSCVDSTVCVTISLSPPLTPGDTIPLDVYRMTDCPDWCGPNEGDSSWVYIVSDCDIAVEAFPDTAICGNDSIIFDAIVTGSSTYTCHWWPEDPFADPMECSPTGWVDSTGYFRVRVIDDSTLCEVTDSVLIIVSHLEVDAGPDGHICPEASIELGCSPTAFGGIEPYTYSWQYLDATEFSSSSNPVYDFADSSVTIVLQVIDSIGCEAWDTVVYTIDYEPVTDVTILTPTDGAIETPGSVHFQWEPIPPGVDATYEFYLDTTLIAILDSTNYYIDIPCGEFHTWYVRAFTNCFETYLACDGDTIETVSADTAVSSAILFSTMPCGVPSADYVHVPDGDWTACDPDSIVWVITDSAGIVESSIEVRVNGISYTTSSPELTWDGSTRLLFEPSPMWPSGTTVNACLISAMNVDSVWLPDSVCGEFYVDFDPPVVWGIDPAPGATVIAASWTTLDLFIYDSLSGLDESTVWFTIDGGTYYLTDPEVTWDGDSTVSIDISSLDIDCGDTVLVYLTASDSPDWCDANFMADTFDIYTAPCGLNANIIEPLPNTISACEDQEIIMSIEPSSGGSRSLLWLTDPSYGSGNLTDYGSIGYANAAESLAAWGWSVDEIPQTTILTSALLNSYSVVVIGNVKTDGPRMYTTAERTALESYVFNGGKILSISGWVVEDTDINLENFLLNDFGLGYEPFEFYEDSIIPVISSPIDPGVSMVPGNGVKWAVGLDECWALRGSDCACGVKNYGSGKIVMYFDEHWLFNGPHHDMDFTTHQNARLFANIMSFLAPMDTLCPVDPSTIVLEVEGSDYMVSDPELDWTDPILTWTPPADWIHSEEVDVCLTDVLDTCGGTIDDLPICWTFHIDLQPPDTIVWEPPCGSNLDSDTGAIFHIVLEDGPALIESVKVSIDGTDYDLGTALTISGSDAEFSWNPVTDGGMTLSPGDIINFCVHTGDSGITYCDPHETLYCCDYYVPLDTGIVIAEIVEPTPNSVSACDDQQIIMTIDGSTMPDFGSILWINNFADDNGSLHCDGDVCYGILRDTLISLGYDIVEIDQDSTLSDILLAPYGTVVIGPAVDKIFSGGEALVINRFVTEWGRSLLSIGLGEATNPSHNSLVDQFDMQYVSVGPYYYWGEISGPIDSSHPVTSSISRLSVGGTPFIKVSSGRSLAYHEDSCILAIREFGPGRIVAYADDQTFMDSHRSDVNIGLHDNKQFALNTFSWLANTIDIDCPIIGSTIILEVEGALYDISDTELEWDPETLVFTPSILWNHYDTVDVCLREAEDSCGAILPSPVCWEFYIDLQAPDIANLNPPCGTPIIPGFNDVWQIELEDWPAGIMPDSTKVIFEGTEYPIPGPDTSSTHELEFTWDPDSFGITLTPGDTVEWCISAMDNPDYCPPNETLFCCEYPITDTGGPIGSIIRVPDQYISACDPESIIVNIVSSYPVVESTIVLNVDGMSYNTNDDRLTWFDPSLTFDPEPDWNDHDTVFASLVEAVDIFGNPCINCPLTWQFFIDRISPTSAMLEPGTEIIRDVRPQILISVDDLLAGVNPDSLILVINGTEYYYPGDFTWLPYDDSLGGHVRWIAGEHGVTFNAGDTVEVEIYAMDNPDYCGPNQHFAEYEFFVAPFTPCLVNPNPFTPNTDDINDITAFDWPNMTTEGANIMIFDLRNVLIRKYELGPQENYHNYIERSWDGKDENGKLMPQGLYLYVIESEGRIICNGTITLIR